ncbi:MAG: helix-turn-helix transcriptional regulator [Microbacteriaceae bacterium]|nr:helix-turn-helix transcriptional regulator [Microbacteriaceae bacterium]MCI1207603.1 helix-turn-helix transcriptional regulator [Microbacteriaceae bacterium]
MPTTSMAYDVFREACPSRMLLTDVAKRWSVLVLVALSHGPQRFSCLTAEIEGISDRMLSQTLKALSAEGLVVRRCDGYGLTETGQPVAERVRELVQALYTVLSVREPSTPREVPAPR